MYDVQRRLKLLQETKAYVKRTGFTKDCEVIASVKPEHLLTAMALHGEKQTSVLSLKTSEWTSLSVKLWEVW